MSNNVANSRRLALTIGVSALALAAAGAAHAGDFIHSDSLLISTTTYEDVVAAAGLVAGVTAIPGGTAVSNGDLNTVWNNASVDASFGVTSPITIEDLSPTNAAAVLSTKTFDTSQIVTSFSSKSELGLNIVQTPTGPVVTFMGYAPGGGGYPTTGAGALDVSNSDTTAYSDPTNPVTMFYGTNYAFNRSVVALNADGSYSITQTLAHGGNNGRGAVLAPNGLYYTVGNSNNGTGTPPALTKSTGLEVVTPGAPNSTMIDPSFKALSGDKAGKSSNFRGLTYYGGNLYFTKGSGSNGIDTVYTVSKPNGQLPTAATASQAKISILPGFPTDPAKPSPDYTQPLLRQPDDALCRRRGRRLGAERRSREMDAVERDLASGLYATGRPDRRHLQCRRLGLRGNNGWPAQPHRRRQQGRDRHALGDDRHNQRVGRQRRRSQ